MGRGGKHGAFTHARYHPTMIRGLFLPGIFALALAAAPVAHAERFAIDPVHTRVAFQVSHAGFSWPVGSFSQATGVLDFDPGDWSTARVEVRIPLATLQLGDEKWQGRILDPTFFDAKNFPEAHFVSTKVEGKGADEAEVTGDLTLHGVTRPVTLHVKLNQLARHPMPPFRLTAGFSAYRHAQPQGLRHRQLEEGGRRRSAPDPRSRGHPRQGRRRWPLRPATTTGAASASPCTGSPSR
jgi:polyisoprenoid-binding protein YceI